MKSRNTLKCQNKTKIQLKIRSVIQCISVIVPRCFSNSFQMSWMTSWLGTSSPWAMSWPTIFACSSSSESSSSSPAAVHAHNNLPLLTSLQPGKAVRHSSIRLVFELPGPPVIQMIGGNSSCSVAASTLTSACLAVMPLSFSLMKPIPIPFLASVNSFWSRQTLVRAKNNSDIVDIVHFLFTLFSLWSGPSSKVREIQNSVNKNVQYQNYNLIFALEENQPCIAYKNLGIGVWWYDWYVQRPPKNPSRPPRAAVRHSPESYKMTNEKDIGIDALTMIPSTFQREADIKVFHLQTDNFTNISPWLT